MKRRSLVPTGLRLLPGYRPSQLPGDLMAGLLVAALAVPQALVYGTVAGVPVEVGLYSLPPALLAYAIFGSSRVLSVGPVSTVSVLSGSIVSQMAGGDEQKAIALTSALAISAGVILLIAGSIRVGWVSQFLSEPILTGFVTGLAILIILGELPTFLGLPTPTGNVPERLWGLISHAQRPHFPTLAISILTLNVLFIGGRLWPRVPWSLLVLIGSIAESRSADLVDQGARVVGHVPSGLPTLTIPIVGWGEVPNLITAGVAVAGIGIAEGLSAAKAFTTDSRNARFNADSELVANGAADVASGMFSGMGVAGSLSKTAANIRAGATTQISSVAAALTVILVLLFATNMLAPLPRAVLSAIVIHGVWDLIRPNAFRHYLAIRRNDGIACIVACVGVLALGPLNGLLLAIGQSLLGLIYTSSQVSLEELGKVPGEKSSWDTVDDGAGERTVPGVAVLHADGPLFYPNAETVVESVLNHVDSRQDLHTVVLDVRATHQLDTTTVDQLDRLLIDLRERDVDLHLAHVSNNVRQVMENAGLLQAYGEDRLWRSVAAAVKAARSGSLPAPVDVAAMVEEDDGPAEHRPRHRRQARASVLSIIAPRRPSGRRAARDIPSQRGLCPGCGQPGT